jgi:hypothetical protein
MTKTVATLGRMSIALALASAGCSVGPSHHDGGSGGMGGLGAGGGGGQSDGGPAMCPPIQTTGGSTSGTMSWNDNGTQQCGLVVIVLRSTAPSTDTLTIDAATADSHAIYLTVSSHGSPLGGTYSCQQGNGTTDPSVSLEIMGFQTSGFAAMSDCSITLGFTTDSAGVEHAHGTFSGMLTTDGGTDTITDGIFDLTDTPSST